MKHKLRLSFVHFVLLLLVAGLACTLPFAVAPSTQAPLPIQSAPPVNPPVLVTVPTTLTDPAVPSTPTIAVTHLMKPSDTAPGPGAFVYDVDSSGTGPEGRAPYGDSYKINRLERPFEQNMIYVPNLDIVTFNLSKDGDWNYVSIELVGKDPNDARNVAYGIELDLNRDGFGDYLIWARPPYTTAWDTSNVKVFKDTNRDSGGLSSEQSDVPFDGDGYDTLIFDGGQGEDPDLAWVRIGAGQYGTVQFAFKRSLPGPSFMMGVWADAGLRDVARFAYNDRFTEEQAGSPESNEEYYPLKALFAVDNTCREAFGFNPTGYEPQLCPPITAPETPKPKETQPSCPYVCPYGQDPYPSCQCWPG